MTSVELDPEETAKSLKVLADRKEEFAKAEKARQELNNDAYRKHCAQANAPAQAPDACGCIPVPNCAYPPPTEFVELPPLKQPSIGLDKIPILIKANARLNVGEMQYGKSQVRRDFVPKEQAKQPCCPKCGTSGCVNRCGACGHVPVAKPMGEPNGAPPAAPPAGAARTDEQNLQNSAGAGSPRQETMDEKFLRLRQQLLTKSNSNPAASREPLGVRVGGL